MTTTEHILDTIWFKRSPSAKRVIFFSCLFFVAWWAFFIINVLAGGLTELYDRVVEDFGNPK